MGASQQALLMCAAASFNPSSLFSGGVTGAWFDFTDEATLFQDTAGTSPVTTAGQSIRRVNDKSGTWTPSPARSTGPVWQDDGLGFMSAYFDGTNGAALTTISVGTDTVGAAGGYTIMAAFTTNATAAHKTVIDSDMGGGAPRIFTSFGVAADEGSVSVSPFEDSWFSTPYTASHTGTYLDTKVLITIEIDNAAWAVRRNGVQVASGTPTSTTLASSAAAGYLTIGASMAGTGSVWGNYFKGNVFACAVINELMTSDKRDTAEAAMAALAGITL
jgi:hypothetical protein